MEADLCDRQWKENFGLISKEYPESTSNDEESKTQWQKFMNEVQRLQKGDPDAEYKVLFLARHGEGVHNERETLANKQDADDEEKGIREKEAKTSTWNINWAFRTGDGQHTWEDARLTHEGVKQAKEVRAIWKRLMHDQKMILPHSFYVSPLWRCLQTCEITWEEMHSYWRWEEHLLPGRVPIKPMIKERLREGLSAHTCNHRSTKTEIMKGFPHFAIEDGFSEEDEMWNEGKKKHPDDFQKFKETEGEQDVRSQALLDEIFDDHKAGTYVSMTSHGGEINSIRRVIKHPEFHLETGGVIVFFVKATRSGHLG
ncbi:MAG: hypothetical protein Q9162_004137 [Coniocarpon cinnabarinum]